MICVVQNHGTSFAGLSRYMLHDKQAETAERVAWSHNHNLATPNPELGGRIMAATAMDQQALKNLAGEVKTGRKLQKSVMHYTLSWHAEERDELTREEMLRAAEASLAALGTDKGEKLGTNKKTGKAIYAPRTQRGIEHQAVIVCHDEGEGSKPHLHVMVNRVHPEHGIALSDSRNFEKLSAWALEYRKSQGKEHYCPERAKNAAIRAQGYRTHNKRPSRNVYEQAMAEREAYKNDPRRAAILQQQRRKAALLKEKQDKKKVQQREEIQAKENQTLAEEKRDRAQLAEQVRKARNRKKNAFREKVEKQAEKHIEQSENLKETQETIKGRVQAALDAVKSKDWMHELSRGPLQAVTQAFDLALSKDRQQRELSEAQEREKRDLQAQIAEKQREALQRLRADTEAKKQARLAEFEAQRAATLLIQRMDQAKMKAEWKELQMQRAVELAMAPPLPAQTIKRPVSPPPLPKKTPEPFVWGRPKKAPERVASPPPLPTPEPPKPLRTTFEQVAAPPAREKTEDKGDSTAPPPKTDAQIKAERREALIERMDRKREERTRDRGPDRER